MEIGKFAQWWADSRGKTGLVLLLLWIAALGRDFRWQYVTHPIVAVGVVVALDTFITRLRFGALVVSLSSVVTGFLVGLILHPTGGLWPVILAGALASLSKNFLATGRGKHVANPAAFGVVVSSLLVGRRPSWWVASWGPTPAILVSVGMLPLLWKLRRQFMPVTFLSIYFLMILFSSGLPAAVSLTLDGTVFLFAFVMLPEIKTSPVQGQWRWGWGVLVGMFAFAHHLLRLELTDPLLTPLLAANFVKTLMLQGAAGRGVGPPPADEGGGVV